MSSAGRREDIFLPSPQKEPMNSYMGRCLNGCFSLEPEILMVSGLGQTALPGISQNGAKVIYTIEVTTIVGSYMMGLTKT